MDAATALEHLNLGNQRFLSSLNDPLYQSKFTSPQLVQGHAPIAMVLACADARTPVEMIFDQPIGQLFVVRIAGNIVTPEVLGSFEFAAGVLGVELLVVLGHTQCGAVNAAIKPGDQPQPVHLRHLIDDIQSFTTGSTCIKDAIDQNIRHSVNQIAERSPFLAGRIEQNKLAIIGARYSIESGAVDFFDSVESSRIAVQAGEKNKPTESMGYSNERTGSV